MPRHTITIRKKRKGWAVTNAADAPMRIICKSCNYRGLAELVTSTCLGTGRLYHCPECKSLNIYADEAVVILEETYERETERCVAATALPGPDFEPEQACESLGEKRAPQGGA